MSDRHCRCNRFEQTAQLSLPEEQNQASRREELASHFPAMILWLYHYLSALTDDSTLRSEQTLDVSLTRRIAFASLTAFVAAVFLGPPAIRWLKQRFREKVVSDSATLNELHADKNDTPTMGGIFIMVAVLISTALFAELSSPFIHIAALSVVLLTALGAWDDWIKQKTTRNGLAARKKLMLQFVIAVGISLLIYFEQKSQSLGTDIVWPIGAMTIPLGGLFIGWAALVIVASCNAVNLTDGLDGLAAGCTVLSGSAFCLLAYLSGHSVFADYLRMPHFEGAGELAVMLGALVGAMLGFLWFNGFPAQVFMGDAGSLPAGGLLGVAALLIRQELLLAMIGGVFVVETLSVIVQVGGYKLTGKRVLRCSPLHNHFVFRGDAETKIVMRFWIVAALLAIAGVASLKLR